MTLENPMKKLTDTVLGKTDDDENGEVKKAPSEMEQMMAKFNQLQDQMKELQQTNLALMTAPPSNTNTLAVPVLDLKGIPNPLDDPEGYARELADRTVKFNQAREDYSRSNQNVSNQRSNRMEALWEDFSDKYKDLAVDQDVVEVAALKVSKAAQARGIDLDKYMFQNSGKYLSDVADQVKKIKGTQVVTEKKEDGEDENRTGGIFGGQESGSKPNVGSTVVKGDMVSDLQEMQKKSGFY